MKHFDIIQLDSIEWGSLIVSLLCGGIIGFEREYQNKSAGFRTIILISLGATIFTLVSRYAGGQSDDRIASNIVTGIGFIGAGVIFKDNLWVKGLTTAAVIWVSASIGMLCGMGHYLLSILLSIVVVIVLSLFYKIEIIVDLFHHRKQFTIEFIDSNLKHLYELEQTIKMRDVSSKRIRLTKTESGNLWVALDLRGNKNRIKNINELMINMPEIKSFQSM